MIEDFQLALKIDGLISKLMINKDKYIEESFLLLSFKKNINRYYDTCPYDIKCSLYEYINNMNKRVKICKTDVDKYDTLVWLFTYYMNHDVEVMLKTFI